MCIRIIRWYNCFDIPEPLDVAGHCLDFIKRCAVPNPSSCLREDALAWQGEFIRARCHDCTGRFIVPRDDQIEVRSPAQDMDREASLEAAANYVNWLSYFLTNLVRNNTPLFPDTITALYQACMLEVACRFDPSHFPLGTWDECHEANEWPEYRNMSAALRRVPARGELYPNEWSGSQDERTELFAGRYKDIPFKDESEALFQDFMQQSRPGEINPYLQNCEVLPYDKYDGMERQHRVFRRVEKAFESYGGREEWCIEWLRHNWVPPRTDPDDEADTSYVMRECILTCIALLVKSDNGLTAQRKNHIIDLCINIAYHQPDWEIGGTHDDVVDGLEDLCNPDTWDEGLIHEGIGAGSYGISGGELMLSREMLRETLTHFRQSNLWRFQDEYDREDLIERAWDHELTQAEIDALPDEMGYGECFICGGAMYPAQALGRLATAEEEERIGHEAVRLRCPRQHVVGKNCFMSYWKAKRLVVDEDAMDRGVVCDLCGRHSLVKMPKVYQPYDMTLEEVLAGQYHRPDWQSARTPLKWIKYAS